MQVSKAAAALDATGKQLMKSAMRQMLCKQGLPSALAFHRILKLARTIADLAEEESIQPAHLAEGYRLAVSAGGVGEIWLCRRVTHSNAYLALIVL